MINELDPVAFLGIRWYAIFILTGIILAVWHGIREGKKLGIYSDFIYWGVIVCVPLAIAGARIWYVLFNLSDFDSLADVLGITSGGLSGLAIQGGVIASICYISWWCHHKRVPLYKVFDIVAPGFLIGQILGRWGNFFNQELYGGVVENTKLFKALLPSFITENMLIDGEYRHPVFLYESLLNLVGLIIMFIVRRKDKKLLSGDLMGFYLVWYGAVRTFTETLRTHGDDNDPLKIGPIYVSILVSVIFIIAGISFLILKRFVGPKDRYIDIIKTVDKNKVDCLLFDLDGTLIDTKRLIFMSFEYTFEKYFPDHKLEDDELESFFGPTLRQTFKRYTDDEALIDEMIEYYRGYNSAHHDEFAKPFDSVHEVIKSLYKKGYKIGVVSSKKKEMVVKGLELCKIEEYIDVVVGEEDASAKPSPDGIIKALNEIYKDGYEGKNILYIGDHPNDIKAAKAAGVKSVGVMYSSKKEEIDNEDPDYEIYRITDLYEILVE